MIASLCIRDKKDKNMECKYVLEFYRKIENGQFKDHDDEERGIMSDFNL